MSTQNYRVQIKPDYAPVTVTGYTATVLIPSGATQTELVSGNTWIVYSNPTGATAAWGLITGAITDQTDLVNYIDSQTSGATSAWSGLTGQPTDNTDLVDYVSQSISAATSGLTSSWSGLTGQPTDNTDLVTLLGGYSLTGTTEALSNALDTHTGNTDIHYPMSGISITESQISDLGNYALESELTGLTESFTSHTGDTSIHFTMDVVDAAISAATSGLTSSWNDLEDKPVFLDYPTVDAFETGHTHSYNNLDDKPTLFTGNTFVASGGTQLSLVGNQLTIYSPTGGTSTIPALSDLTDVTITSLRKDEVLKYNGTKWVNEYSANFKDVYNFTGAVIPKGKLVKVTGSAGALPLIAIADNSVDDNVAGITIEDIQASTTGVIQVQGTLQEAWINTAGMTSGDRLYLNGSGAYTTTKPAASDNIMIIGIVGVVAPASGSLILNMPAFSINYLDLENLPTLFSGDYDDLTNKPTLFTGNTFQGSGGTTVNVTNDVVTIYSVTPTGTTVNWGDVNNKPQWLSGATLGEFQTGHTHSYNDLNNLPTLFDGDYDSLSNKPDLNAYTLTGTTEALSNAFDTHTGDTEIHYAQSAITINVGQILDFGDYALESDVTGLTASFDSHTGDTSIHFTKSDIDLNDLGDVVVTSGADNDTLKLSGSTWVNEAPLDIFANVDDGELLARNGTDITGVTQTKFATSASVSTYTGTTAPATFSPRLAEIKAITGTNYTILAGDNGKVLFSTLSGAAITFPSGFTVGFNCQIIRANGGEYITLTAGGGATIYSPDAKLTGRYMNVIVPVANTWYINGDTFTTA